MFAWLRKMAALVAGPFNVLRGVRNTTEPPQRGTREHLEVYEAAPWPRAVGDKVGTAVACVSYRLVAVTSDGKAIPAPGVQRCGPSERWRRLKALGAAVRPLDDHPFMRALDRPNPFMDRVALLKLTEIHLDFVGDAFWLKERNALGTPVGFWPIPPHWVQELPTADRPFFRFSYRSFQATVPVSEVQWFHEPKPSDPYARGSGLGWTLGDEIQVDEYAAKMASAFFFNRARPDFVFATGVGEEETKRFELDWNNKNQSWWRAHRPYFLAGGGDTVDLRTRIYEFQQPTMEQLVYPNLRKIQRDIILQTWGVAPEMFGIVENSNRATIEAAEYLFAKWVVAPKAERMRAGLQRLAAEDYDERIVVDYESPVMEDKEHRLNAMKAAPWTPTMDEWREVQGLAPEGGELGGSRMVPLASYVTPDPLDPETRPQGAGAAMRSTDQQDDEKDEKRGAA